MKHSELKMIFVFDWFHNSMELDPTFLSELQLFILAFIQQPFGKFTVDFGRGG